MTVAAAGGRRARLRATAGAGILGSIAAALLVLAAPAGPLTLLGALTLACVPGGAAVMSWIDTGDAATQAALTLIVSLTVFALASAVLVWAADWHPRLLVTLAAAGVLSGLVSLTRSARA
jgi:hypothetical protein